MDDIKPVANNQFWFNHDIFGASSSSKPWFEGNVLIEVKRVPKFTVKLDDLNSEEMDFTELWAFLSEERGAPWNWEKMDVPDQSKMHPRFEAAMTHGLCENAEHDVSTLVTMMEGSSFCYCRKYADEEGYTIEDLKCDWRDGGWDLEATHGGKDYDGELIHTTEYRILFPSLGIEDMKSEQYDEQAELAGY